MLHPEALLQAFHMVFTFKCFYRLVVGVVIGIGVGAMPGLTALACISRDRCFPKTF